MDVLTKKLHFGNFLKASLVGAKKPFISRLSGSFSRPISSSFFSLAEGPWDDVSSASLSSKAIHAFDRKRQIQRGNKTKGKRAKRLQCLDHSNWTICSPLNHFSWKKISTFLTSYSGVQFYYLKLKGPKRGGTALPKLDKAEGTGCLEHSIGTALITYPTPKLKETKIAFLRSCVNSGKSLRSMPFSLLVLDGSRRKFNA